MVTGAAHICPVTGLEFFVGRGRPSLYHPCVRDQMRRAKGVAAKKQKRTQQRQQAAIASRCATPNTGLQRRK